MEQVAVSKCDICKEDIAKVFCYECHQFLCQSCKSFHEKFPATKRHTITDSHNIDRSTLIHKLVCEHHNIEFTYYCRDCECLICSQCVTSEHTGHTITNIAEVAGKAREDVKKRLKHIKDNVKTLSDLIEDFKTTKQADIETGTDNFIKEVNKVSQDLIRIIESIAKINVTNASDFLVFEKQQLLYNVAKLEKSHSEYSSIQERYEQILRDKHDVTFFLNHKSLAKEFELLDDIYHPEEPKEVEPLKTDVFLDSVNERIESKYDLSYRRKTERKEKRVASTQKNSGKRQTVNLCPVDEESIHSKMVSVAIEIGNEESEYALSLVNSFNDDPCGISFPNLRQAMPNSILLDSHKKAIAFGYEAENQYYDLVREENHHDCYFFRQFTKDIHKLQDGATTLHTINVKTFDQKKEISAHSLFGMLINFHVDDALSKLIILEVLTPEDFNWVLTIPTYWNNSVRKALIQVARKNTIVASYPEAVSLYWKFWSMKNKLDKIDLFRPEMKYIVVYGSGDTIDLACLEVEEDKSLTQLNTMVTNVEVWKKFLVGIVGKHVYSDFCSQYPNEEDYMLRDFKRKSRSFTDAQIVTLIVPVELRELYEKYSGGDFNDPSNKIVWRGDKMRIKRDLFISLFDEVIAFVVNAVREMVNDPDVMDISHIVCTGRLMQLQMIVCRLRETFHNIDIIDLPEPNISALKGAVILGHYPIVSCKRNFYRL